MTTFLDKEKKENRKTKFYVYNHFKIIIKIHNTHEHDENNDRDPPTT